MSVRDMAIDIAIIGGGLAGMSLLAHVRASGWRGDVIVIDDGAYPLEDRTWSWWSRGDLLLDDAATAQFPSARCASDTWVKTGSLEPYAYRTITGAALSQTVSALASTGVRVTHVPGTAVAVSERDGAQACIVETADGRVAVRAARIYDSVGVGSERGARSGVPRLDFTGWRVRSATAVKLSTGYAFARIQRHCEEIADAVVAGRPDPSPPASRGLARILDRILIGIINAQPNAAQTMLEALVRRLDWGHLLAFLDEEASVRDYIRVCLRVPPTVFVRAGVGVMRRATKRGYQARYNSAARTAGERVSGVVES